MKYRLKSLFIVAMLFALTFPCVIQAQTGNTPAEFEPVDTSGNYVIYGKKSGSPPRFSEFYLENTVTHSRLNLSMDNIYRYAFEHGFLIAYGSFGIDVYREDGTLLVKTGMQVLDFLPGDTLLAASNFDHDWKIFSASGELLASGEGVPWYGFTFKQVFDSLIIVPGPDSKVGLISTRGEWLALPVFSRIEAAENHTLRATIGTRYGTLEPNGIFHEPDSTITDASVHTIVRGIGDPHRIHNAVESSRNPNLRPTILDIFHEYIVAMDPSPGMGYVLINAATKDTFKLPVRQIQSFTFDYPFLRMKYYEAPLYREALLDLNGNLLAENASYVNVVRNGDSTVIVGTARAWYLYDWKMNLVNSSAKMKLPEGDGQNIRALCKGFYAVSVRYDTSGGHGALYEMVDRTGRVITDPIFNSCYYHNNTISVEICNGERGKVDTTGNVYFNNDPAPHRITVESLLNDRSYRKIRIEKSNRTPNRLSIKVNPYCYDRHTSEKNGKWQVESWYNNGKLIARHKKKQVALKNSSSYRRKYRVTEIATVYRHGKKRKRVQFEYTPTWF